MWKSYGTSVSPIRRNEGFHGPYLGPIGRVAYSQSGDIARGFVCTRILRSTSLSMSDGVMSSASHSRNIRRTLGLLRPSSINDT